MEVEGPLHAPAALPPKTTQYTWNKNVICISKNKIIQTQLTCECVCVQVHMYACMVAQINFGHTDTYLLYEDTHIY